MALQPAASRSNAPRRKASTAIAFAATVTFLSVSLRGHLSQAWAAPPRRALVAAASLALAAGSSSVPLPGGSARASRLVADADKYVYDAKLGRVKPSCEAVCMAECKAVAGEKNIGYCKESCAARCVEGADQAAEDDIDPDTPRAARDDEKNAFERFAEAASEAQISVWDNVLLNPGRGKYGGAQIGRKEFDLQPDSVRAMGK